MAIHLLHGDSRSADPLLIGRRIDELLKGIDREGNLNFITFDLNDSGTSFQNVVDSALTIPFLGGRRVVVARGMKTIDRAFAKKSDDDGSEPGEGTRADQILRALDQLAALPDDALLILVEDNGHLDGRTAFMKGLKKLGCTVYETKAMWFDPATGNIRQVVEFIQTEASRLGIRLDSRTAEKFAQLVGSERGMIYKELEKLALYTGPGASPSVEDVENSVTPSYEAGIFHLVDVIGLGKTGEAMNVLADLLDHGAAIPYILSMIARQVRLIARVREATNRGVPSGNMAKELGESPFVIKKIERQARIFPDFNYSSMLEYLMETDLHIKRGTMQPRLALETLITRMAALKRGTGTHYYTSRRSGGSRR